MRETIERIARKLDENRQDAVEAAIKPAAALFSLLWLVATIGFGIYAANFGSYGATYGSLGAVVILLTWFYLTGYFLLLAAEYAAVRAKASRSDT